MDLGIKNRLALVTGASKGIGRAIALALAREGARVILVARSTAPLETVRREIATPDRTHHTYSIDLMADDGVPQLVQAIGKDLGEPDIIVHNLGGSCGVTQTFAPAADWRKVWQYNLGIAHDLNRAFIPGMAKRRWGRIVHLTTLSTKTFHGYPPHVAALVPKLLAGDKAAELVFLSEALKASSTGKRTATRDMSDTGSWSVLDPKTATAEAGRVATEAFVTSAVAFINHWKELRPLGANGSN